MSEMYSNTMRSVGLFGISDNEAGHTYYFQAPDFDGLFQLMDRIYNDIGRLMDRANVKFSKGFEKKLAACSSQILVDLEGKVKVLKTTTVEFFQFAKFTREELSKAAQAQRAGHDIGPIMNHFVQEFFRQLGNLALAYGNRQNALSLETYNACRHVLHERKLDVKYLKIVEAFYFDFEILAQNLKSFFMVKLQRAFVKTDRGVVININMLLKDFDEIIQNLAEVILELEAASKA